MASTLRQTVRQFGALIILILLAIVLASSSPAFLRPVNLLNILNQNSPLLILAAALTPVIIAGGFDLSTGAMLAVSGCASAWVAANYSPALGLAIAPFVGLVLGTINGLIITGFKVHSFLATLATTMVFNGLAVLITGGALISVRIPEYAWLGRGQVGMVHIAILIMLAVVGVVSLVLNRTTLGRYIFAVGGNEEAALLSGVRIQLTRIATFSFTGFAAGIAGAITVSRIGQAQPLVGAGIEMQAIAAVVLGGTSVYGGEGAVWRSVVGVLLIALINNGFNLLNVNPFVKDFTMGLIIVIAIALGAANRSR